MKIQANIARIVIGTILLFWVASSCKTTSRAEKQYEKEELRAERVAQRALKKDIKAHYKIQAQETKKMMRMTKREAEKYNSYKRRR